MYVTWLSHDNSFYVPPTSMEWLPTESPPAQEHCPEEELHELLFAPKLEQSHAI